MSLFIDLKRGQVKARIYIDLAELSTGAAVEGTVLADAEFEYFGPKLIFPYSFTIGIWQLSLNMTEEELKKIKTHALLGINKRVRLTIKYKDLSQNLPHKFDSLG